MRTSERHPKAHFDAEGFLLRFENDRIPFDGCGVCGAVCVEKNVEGCENCAPAFASTVECMVCEDRFPREQTTTDRDGTTACRGCSVPDDAAPAAEVNAAHCSSCDTYLPSDHLCDELREILERDDLGAHPTNVTDIRWGARPLQAGGVR